MAIILSLIYIVGTLILLYRSVKPLVWEVSSVIYMILMSFYIGMSWWVGLLVFAAILSVIACIRIESIRAAIADALFKRATQTIPKLSKTEEEALNAGDTWLEQDIFRGKPDWERLASISSKLTAEEQAFLDNETQALCDMLDEWDIRQRQDLPPTVWSYIKEKGFWGMVIDKKYGGKGFSARAHSDVIVKIASRSGVAAVTIMVPNSLGPGELLQHYGTEEQKDYFLPRLAKGIEIPCFALTEPEAGSDATSIKSDAVVMEKTIDGKKVIGLNLTLNKRWITLSPVATLIGLAVNLKDPHELLSGVGQEGITCLLIPRNTPNLKIGNRHLPADQPFMNGTIRGENLFVPMTSIIGGQEKAGQGWKMLVECLSIGRSISLPALSAASSGMAYVTSGAFARVRRQFNVEIGQFEGVEEKLAEIAGLNYLVNATRILTVGAVYANQKPSVASAITKYFNTELARITINDSMDIHAGRAVVIGPRNYMSNYYQSIPISVTVEGANIMTRNLLIFGQGSMACHPYIKEEFYAVAEGDKNRFRQLIWDHLYYFLNNFAKTICSAWTGGWLITVPNRSLKREYQKLTRLSYAFSWLSDLSLMYLGGALKRKERISARLADGMSYLYMAMAALDHFQKNEENRDEKIHAKWAVTYCYYHAEKAMMDLCKNFPSRPLGLILRWLAFPMGQSMRYPSDSLDHKLAQLMTQNNQYRQKLCQTLYFSGDTHQPVDQMENALQLLIKHQGLYQKISDLRRYKSTELHDKLTEKVKNGQMTQEEMDVVLTVEQARWEAIQVDEFPFSSLMNREMNDDSRYAGTAKV